MEPAIKDAKNPHFNSKYASLAAVIQAIKGPLADSEITYIQLPSITEGSDGKAVVSVNTMLLHTSGEYISGSVSMPGIDKKPQAIGSALTYARRYGLICMLGISAEEDDDGNVAQTTAARPMAVSPNSKRSADLWAWAKKVGITQEKYHEWVKSVLGQDKEWKHWTDGDFEKLEADLAKREDIKY